MSYQQIYWICAIYRIMYIVYCIFTLNKFRFDDYFVRVIPNQSIKDKIYNLVI
jgi:hypothetical protein